MNALGLLQGNAPTFVLTGSTIALFGVSLMRFSKALALIEILLEENRKQSLGMTGLFILYSCRMAILLLPIPSIFLFCRIFIQQIQTIPSPVFYILDAFILLGNLLWIIVVYWVEFSSWKID